MGKKKKLLAAGVFILLAVLLGTAWSIWCSSTKIAFVHYQTITLGQIAKANSNSFIKINSLSTDNLEDLDKYDMVFIDGMGLRITEEQRQLIEKAAAKGVPVLTTAATNPANRIVSLDSVQAGTLTAYIGNGGRKNYRSMLNYVRKYIDRKIIGNETPQPVVEAADEMIYHTDPGHPENEELGFNTISEYEKFLKKEGLWKEDAPRIILTGLMGEPSELIDRLEKSGNMVFPLRMLQPLVGEPELDSIRPSAIINMAHGRLGDKTVQFLKEKNIPLFATVNVNMPVEEWEKDKMGMSGGFLSQSIVTPEIDGAIRPYALFGHYTNREGLEEVRAIPGRLETFVQTVNNYIKLQQKPNAEKKIAICYYKGPGQNSMVASGMEVLPSLYNLLVRLKQEGYKVDGLPADYHKLGEMIQAQGAVFNGYAEGAMSDFIKNGNPEIITRKEYEQWTQQTLEPEKIREVENASGPFPGKYMCTDDQNLAIARLQLGNIVLMPQYPAGVGSNQFKIVHGTHLAPPYPYIASYLWAQFGFKADALIHFGTHGSLEFTPEKQVALSSYDWPDRLVGALPHFYLYTIGNVGEGIIAKRRAYAGLQSYLTPPFTESKVRGMYQELMQKIESYDHLLNSKINGQEEKSAEKAQNLPEVRKASLAVKAATIRLGIDRDLELDTVPGKPYSEDEILRIENFAEELSTEKIVGQMYTLGVPYSSERIESSVLAMAADPIAYSLMSLDRLRNRVGEGFSERKPAFTRKYLNPAKTLVEKILKDPALVSDRLVCTVAEITTEELAKARTIAAEQNRPKGMMAMMMAAQNSQKKGDGRMKGSPEMMKRAMEAMKNNPKAMAAMKGMMKKGATGAGMRGMQAADKGYSKKEIEFALAVNQVDRTIQNVENYKRELTESPQKELSSMINALNGRYTAPSPGGDPIANPNTLPTGRNLFGINAEATPSEQAWEKGKQLAENTIEMYKRRHNDSIPRKISYTLWSSEFIETQGASIAQILYMLGVEPVRDSFGRVTDLKLIPSKELGRPRIDVVVQTSGQLRDIAASRLFLINRAVEMAASAKDDSYENLVSEGVTEAERALIEKGLTPKDAREMSAFRVFGGINGMYGTGIQGMVMSSDRWNSEKEIADTYLNNMGAYYGNEKDWELFRQYAFEAALQHTDAVIQPRQSNTWGALSLDHVYEFMGGMNLTVRNVTGKDPDAYLSDYRNRNNMRMQEVKEAIGIEGRTTIFNPNYIKEQMKGGAGSAAHFAEIVENTFGWNVMKPKAIDKRMWDEIYSVYVKDKFNLGVQQFFETENPAALQQMTAVMLESARKGLWKADRQQLADIAELHTRLIEKYKPGCSGFVCDNAKLRKFIASKVNAESAEKYEKSIEKVREAAAADNDKKGMVMKKEEMNSNAPEQKKQSLSNFFVGIGALVVLLALVFYLRSRSRKLKN